MSVFDMKPRVRVAVVGPYMCGKTTLCNSIHDASLGYEDWLYYSSTTVMCDQLVCKSVTGKCEFTLVDCPGLEKFGCIVLPVIRDCDVVVSCQRALQKGADEYMAPGSASLEGYMEYMFNLSDVVSVYTMSDLGMLEGESYSGCYVTSIKSRPSFTVLYDVLSVICDGIAARKRKEEEIFSLDASKKRKHCC